MKVSREQEAFRPVTITLESQEELDWLFSCVASTSVKEANKTFADEVGGRLDRFNHSTCDAQMYEEIKKLFVL